ncbi:unnamed protein product [Tilletia controversa]|nr:unnamed protein product [Tilletia controversa]
MRVLHPFVLLIFPILVAALPLHDSGVVQDPTAPSKLAARFSFDPSFSRSMPSAADHFKEHNPAAPPQHPHALSGSLETSVLEKRKKVINPPTAGFGWLPGGRGPSWPRANRGEQTEPTTEAAKTLGVSGAPDVVVNELSATADLVKKSANFFGESLFGMSKNGDGGQWGRPARATKDEKRYAVSKVSQADSTEVKRANAVVLRPGDAYHPGHNVKAFGFGPGGEGPGWH